MDTEMLPESEVLSEGSEEEQPAKAKEQYPHPFHWHAEEYYSDEYKETPRTVSAIASPSRRNVEVRTEIVDRTQNVRAFRDYSREAELVD